ncbi:MAG: heme lyase CcmF/NrfE family subunit [Gemmatimonadota bacterium]
MLRLIGFAAVAAAFAIAIFGIVAAVVAVKRRDAGLMQSARAAVYTNFVLMSVSNLAMITALLTHDFSIDYVAQVGSRATPAYITVISLWSALEGSILFWGWVLSAYTAGAIWFARQRAGALGAYATATMLFVGGFFYLLLLGPASPWGLVSPVPLDGPGPNPLLQNHWLMGVHPPLLYLGYVGFTVPFGFAMGALLSGQLDDTWVRLSRKWTLAAWAFLSLAIVAGMWWSYDVLGWGGYWAWDPVENASFMPWLTATAFLHSVMVEERRGMLRAWNMSLVIATFLLTILGTTITRSGILSSVHAFAEGPIGLFFISFMAITLLGSLMLLAGRAGELRGEARLDRMASRETVFLFNNLILTAFTFTVLLGTLFPLVAEAARGVKVTVGAPYFNSMTIPLCVALLFLVGVGPALPWKGVEARELKSRFLVPVIGLLVATALALLAGVRGGWGLAAFGFAGFALVTNVREYVTATLARRRAAGSGFLGALTGVVRANPRRYGGFLAHIGLVLIAIGIAASSIFRLDREVTLRGGESVAIHDYVVRFDQLRAEQEPHKVVVYAQLTAFTADGKELGRMYPALNYYEMRGGEPITTPAVRSRLDEDLYINLLAFEQNGANATLHVIIEPLVAWIWIGTGVVAFGALISLVGGRGRRPAPIRVPSRPAQPGSRPRPVEVS